MMLTNVATGHVPVTVTGTVVVAEPVRGEIIIAAVDGANPFTVPLNPTDPAWGFCAGGAADAAKLDPRSSTPTIMSTNVSPAYEVCACGRILPECAG